VAEGRILKRSISWDARVGQLSPCSALLYTLSIPHLDVDGRMLGAPAAVRGTVIPVLAEANGWSDLDVELWMSEWIATRGEDGHLDPLVWWYSVRGTLVVEFRGFAKNQQLRRDREARSLLPPPPADLLSERVPSCPVPSGPLAAMQAAATQPGTQPGVSLPERVPSCPVPSGPLAAMQAAATQPGTQPGVSLPACAEVPVPSETEAAMPRPGRPPIELSTRGRGYSRSYSGSYSGSEREAQGEREGEGQLAASSAAREARGQDIAQLLADRFTSLFGTEARLRDALRPRLERAVAELGLENAIRLMEERLSGARARPGSLAFFLPAFEERAAILRSREGAPSLEQIDRWVEEAS
jgi:hypothetical protein